MQAFDTSLLKLVPTSTSALSGLIHESEFSFSAPASNPDETAADLFRYFQERFEKGEDHLYQPLAYHYAGNPISYIVALGYKDNVIAIGPMYVSEAFRGYGLGTRQVQDFIRYAKRRGFDGIFTKTWAKNEASRTIFNKTGFNIIGSKPNDRADGDSTIKYLLEL